MTPLTEDNLVHIWRLGTELQASYQFYLGALAFASLVAIDNHDDQTRHELRFLANFAEFRHV